MSQDKEQSGRLRGERRHLKAGLLMSRHLLGLLVLAVLTLLLLVAPTMAAASTPEPKPPASEGGPTQPSTPLLHETPTVQDGPYSSDWERVTLRELADALGWPPVVAEDSSGKLSIELALPSGERAQVFIRPFGYQAGAEAAFAADQEDSRLAEFQVTAAQFYSYTSYIATLRESGIVAQRRLHWVADRWVMGVDVNGSSSVLASLDLNTVGAQLLYLATQHGLPAPSGGPAASPEPTHSSPPSTTPTAVRCTISFSDVEPAHWAYSYISELACLGTVGGYADGTFRPQNLTTRAQLSKMLVLSEGWTLANPSTPTFKDVEATHIFYRYVETAYAHGVISGYTGGKFKPDEAVTRAQVAKMIVRTRGWAMTVQSPYALCDVQADHWAWLYVQVAIQHHAFSGYANGCFYPDAYATRAQLAKVVALSRH